MIKVLPPKTAKEVVARERDRKARTTLLIALPEDHLLKFHKMADARDVGSYQIKGLHKGYDRFQTLLSQLEIHGAGVSHEDANKKFLRVFERNVKGTTTSSLNTQNVAFVSSDNTSSTNDVAMISMRIKKFYKRTGRKLQFDTKDPVGFDKTKVECFNCHKIGHVARDCRAKGNQDNRRRDAGYNGTKTRDNGRRPAYQDNSKALVTINEEDINWSGHIKEDAQNYAMMAYSSSNSGSNNEGNLVRGLPSKIFKNDHTCVACQKGKQHKASLENQANNSAGPKEANNSACTQANDDQTESLRKEATHDIQNANTSSTNLLNIVSKLLSTTGPSRAFNDGELSYPDDPSMPHLEDIYASPSEGIFTDSSYDDKGV
nr:hypothetical protein [Tanacetum cinerariifolium]